MLSTCHDIYLGILLGLEIIHANRFDYSHGDPDCNLPVFNTLDNKLNNEPTIEVTKDPEGAITVAGHMLVCGDCHKVFSSMCR